MNVYRVPEILSLPVGQRNFGVCKAVFKKWQRLVPVVSSLSEIRRERQFSRWQLYRAYRLR